MELWVLWNHALKTCMCQLSSERVTRLREMISNSVMDIVPSSPKVLFSTDLLYMELNTSDRHVLVLLESLISHFMKMFVSNSLGWKHAGVHNRHQKV